MERLYFQYQPDEASLGKLLAVQKTAQAAYGGREVSSQSLHLTVLHVGILSRVYEEFQAAVPDLTTDRFQVTMEELMQTVLARDILPATLDIQLIGYKRFNPAHNTLVALAARDKKLMHAQTAAVDVLRGCITSAGIANADGFMASSENFKHALAYEPHISLLRGAGRAAVIPDLQESLHLELVPPKYDLNHGRYT